MRVRRTPEAAVVTLRPVEPVVAALVARCGPVRYLIVRQTGGAEQLVGEVVLVGLVVVVGMPVVIGRERRARFHRQRVGAHMRRVEREHPAQRCLPVGEAFARNPVDEVEVEGVNSRLAGPRHGPHHVLRIVGAPEAGQHRRHHGLDAEAQPVHSVGHVRGEQFRADRVGVALDGDLGVGRARDGVEDVGQQRRCQKRRGATAEEDAGRWRQAGGHDPPDLLHDRPAVFDHEMVAIGPRGKRAIVATLGAERHVDVRTEGRDVHGEHHLSMPETGSNGCRASSRR